MHISLKFTLQEITSLFELGPVWKHYYRPTLNMTLLVKKCKGFMGWSWSQTINDDQDCASIGEKSSTFLIHPPLISWGLGVALATHWSKKHTKQFNIIIINIYISLESLYKKFGKKKVPRSRQQYVLSNLKKRRGLREEVQWCCQDAIHSSSIHLLVLYWEKACWFHLSLGTIRRHDGAWVPGLVSRRFHRCWWNPWQRLLYTPAWHGGWTTLGHPRSLPLEFAPSLSYYLHSACMRVGEWKRHEQIKGNLSCNTRKMEQKRNWQMEL